MFARFITTMDIRLSPLYSFPTRPRLSPQALPGPDTRCTYVHGFFDTAEPGCPSPWRSSRCCLRPRLQPRHFRSGSFRCSIACPYAPLPTLRRHPHCPRTAPSGRQESRPSSPPSCRRSSKQRSGASGRNHAESIDRGLLQMQADAEGPLGHHRRQVLSPLPDHLLLMAVAGQWPAVLA